MRSRRRSVLPVSAVLSSLAVVMAARAQSIPPPSRELLEADGDRHATAAVQVVAKPAGGRAVRGRAVGFDDRRLWVRDVSGREREVAWADLPVAEVEKLLARVVPKADAVGWLRAGRVLRSVDPDGAAAGAALDRAVELDPALKARADAVRAGRGVDGGRDGGASAGAPRWPDQSDADRAAAVAELKARAETVARTIDVGLRLRETEYFLFYSDLSPKDGDRWAGLLDRMYARLAELFAVPRGENLWRGKALVMVFTLPLDFQRCESEFYGNRADPAKFRGFCHNFPDGRVEITFIHQPDEREFADVLVHESVHGFLHRYRSPVHVPSWANEGLANVISAELVEKPGAAAVTLARARDRLRLVGVSDRFFDARQIEGDDYPVAQLLTEFMIRQGKRRYVAFIDAIKDGVGVDRAFTDHYGASRDRVVAAFLDHVGVTPPAGRRR